MKCLKKFLGCLIVLAVAVLLIGSLKPEKATRYEPYVIGSGDTLWDIAKEFTPEDRDCRDTIAEIEEVNGIDNSTIYAGQVIIVPIYEEER